MKYFGWLICSVMAVQMIFAPAAFAEDVFNAGDTAWMLVSSALVMFMLPGLALFYGGLVRRKNVLGTMMHSFTALGVITVQWIIIGYTLAFGSDVGGFIGNLDHLFLKGITYESLHGSIPAYVFVMFQGMFAIITPALIAGAFAERIKFSGYIVFIVLWTTLVYDPIAHWVWGEGGWLFERGALDFAGGTVVHISSGVSALAAVIVLGKRIGHPAPDMVPHNLTATLLGAGMLWFGWFGFNAGSALAANASAALAFTATHIASATGCLGWLLAEKIHVGKPSALGAASGIVAGLVAITPASGFVEPVWAMVIGFIAGYICFRFVMLKDKFGYDDSLDAFGIHGIGGSLGALATGLVATVGGTGLFYGDAGQFGIQAVSVAVTAGYAFSVTYVLIIILDKTIGLRIDPETELSGLDQTQHGEVGYNL